MVYSVIGNKARLVAKSYNQEITDYDTNCLLLLGKNVNRITKHSI
jgi:hypothetical protein